MTRALARLVVAAAISGGVVVVPAAAGTTGASCAAAGEVRVAVVVDFGDDPAAPRGAASVCVPVEEGASGAVALARRAEALGTPAPRYEGGFLCAIDGIPATGCGNKTGGTTYWSYWHGDGDRWAYSNVGAATWRLRAGDVEGWRFLRTDDESQAAPPRAAPTPCAEAAAVAPPATPVPARPAPTSPPATTAPPAAPTTSVGAAPTATSTTTSTTAALSTEEDALPPSARRTSAARRDDGGPPVGLLVAAAAVVALGVAAGLRFRRGGTP